jgi:hypothetical protein
MVTSVHFHSYDRCTSKFKLILEFISCNYLHSQIIFDSGEHAAPEDTAPVGDSWGGEEFTMLPIFYDFDFWYEALMGEQPSCPSFHSQQDVNGSS